MDTELAPTLALGTPSLPHIDVGALREPVASEQTTAADSALTPGTQTEHLTMAGLMSTSAAGTSKADIARLALASEFRVLSSLRHPNIVSVLDYGFQANGSPFFTMRWLRNPMSRRSASRPATPWPARAAWT